MAEINIKVDVPEGFEKKFESALSEVVQKFVKDTEFSLVDKILSDSELKDRDIEMLSKELKEKVSEKHKH